MVMVGGGSEKVSPKSSYKMEEFEQRSYTGTKPQVLAVWNIKSNDFWIKL